MMVPSSSDVLAEVERALQAHPRVALCQIVRVQGSTSGKAEIAVSIVAEPERERRRGQQSRAAAPSAVRLV